MIRSKIILLFASALFANNSFGQPAPLFFNFDTIEPVYIDNSLPNNIWQIGVPQKTFFNVSFNGTRAILTDTVNVYPINNTSSFIVKTPTHMSNYGGIHMWFKHKFDTDTLLDGGTIEVSQDSMTWTNLLSSQALLYANSFYSSSNSALGFSGHSNGWQTANCYWNYPNSQFLFIKFKFTSDGNQNNKEGWMIDNLYFTYDLGIGINEPNNYSNINTYPNPVTDNFTLDLTTAFSKPCSATIFDMQGKMLKQISIPANQTKFSVSVSELAEGVYFLSLQCPEGNYVKKFVK